MPANKQDKPANKKPAQTDPSSATKNAKDTAANKQQPTKPAHKKNPVGTDHNPSQGSPSTRKNPAAGKEH